MPKPSLLSFRLSLAGLLCLSGFVLAFAEDTSSSTDVVPADNTPDYLCGEALLDQGASVVASYETFLNEYFQIDTPSSEQFENALNYYRFTKLAIEGIYQDNLNLSTSSDEQSTLETANGELQYCMYVRDSYLDYIKNLFQRQYLGSTSYKVTFRVVDGLKAMNADLDSLAETFNETFPTLFSKMNNDLPCYARSCASK